MPENDPYLAVAGEIVAALSDFIPATIQALLRTPSESIEHPALEALDVPTRKLIHAIANGLRVASHNGK